MLPKNNRLPLRSLPTFFSIAQKQQTRFFTLFYSPAPSLWQAAVIVPKKTLPLATSRNKIKRQLYELLKPLVKNELGLQLAVYVKPAAAKTTFVDLSTEFKEAYDQITKNLSST